MDEPIRYVRPHFFDWGVYKSHGELILLTTLLLYLGCIVVCLLLIRQIGRSLAYPRTTLAVGLLSLLPMSFAALESLMWQMTSAHYQERTHIPALKVIALHFGVILVLDIAVRWIESYLRPKGKTPAEFSLRCECGRGQSVAEGSAGTAFQCVCRRTILVPSLSELRARVCG
jgi:hypothetical protein